MKTRCWYALTDLVIVAVMCTYYSKRSVITPQLSVYLAEIAFRQAEVRLM